MRTIHQADPNAVLAFLEVAERQSFRSAATALGVPRSTLSQRVADLERHLGASLLTRTTRSVKLTDLGTAYLQEVAPAMAALRAAEALVGQLRAHPTGRLRLTAPFELGQCLLPAALADYATRYPEVRVQLELTDRQVNLVDEGYDLAIRVGPLDDSGLMAQKLAQTQRRGVYGSPDYLAGAGTPMEPQDLTGHRCLAMTGSRTPNIWAFSQDGRPRSVTVEPCLSANSFFVLQGLALAGVGLACLPVMNAATAVEEGRLVEVLTAYAAPATPLFAVYPSARNIAPAVRAMLTTLTTHLLAEPADGVLPRCLSGR